ILVEADGNFEEAAFDIGSYIDRIDDRFYVKLHLFKRRSFGRELSLDPLNVVKNGGRCVAWNRFDIAWEWIGVEVIGQGDGSFVELDGDLAAKFNDQGAFAEREDLGCAGICHLSFSLFGIEVFAEAIADEIESKNCQCDRNRGKEKNMRRIV